MNNQSGNLNRASQQNISCKEDFCLLFTIVFLPSRTVPDMEQLFSKYLLNKSNGQYLQTICCIVQKVSFFLNYSVFCSIKLFQCYHLTHTCTHTNTHAPKKTGLFQATKVQVLLERSCVVLKFPTDTKNDYQHFLKFAILQVLTRP